MLTPPLPLRLHVPSLLCLIPNYPSYDYIYILFPREVIFCSYKWTCFGLGCGAQIALLQKPEDNQDGWVSVGMKQE